MIDDSDDSEDTCIAYKVIKADEEGVAVAFTAPHKESEHGAAIEAAEQFLNGHETVFETKDAGTVRASVGYSKNYAENYDSVFGRN